MKTTTTIYCYHCRIQHPREDMRMIVTKSGKRWRCVQSIVAAKSGSREAREAFGRKTTANNKAEAQLQIRMAVPSEK